MTAFSASSYNLGMARGEDGAVVLERVDADTARMLGEAFAGIDPWQAYGFSPIRLERSFAIGTAPDTVRLALRVGGALAGGVILRPNWLRGPYLQFLGILPAYQRHGLGRCVLAWMECEAGPEERNLWLCCSHFNTKALSFYEAHGFERVALLDDLAVDGIHEHLLRKRLFLPRSEA